MPELPEVETIRRQLAAEIVGKKIVSVEYDTPKMLRPVGEEFAQAVTGLVISSIDRRAKMLFLDLDNGQSIAIHLKLNGRLLHRERTDPADEYVHIKLVFNDDSELRFADSRKFGFMELKVESEKLKVIEGYGPEPLDDLSREKFFEIVHNSRRRIKDLLMDQKSIAGVGNIYANDALWLGKIHPETAGQKLSHQEIDTLFDTLESVLKEALIDGGASDQWYRQLHGEEGHYQEHFKVYGQTGKECVRHPGEKIQYLKVSQRGTFICPRCQVKR